MNKKTLEELKNALDEIGFEIKPKESDEKCNCHECSNKPYKEIVNELMPLYKEHDGDGLNDYLNPPIVIDRGGNVIIDNTENEMMFASSSPALHDILTNTRYNNYTIADVIGDYFDKGQYVQGLRQLLEYTTQFVANAADASAFDTEMRIMCTIVDEGK